jgi:hypothetical protein
MSSRGPGELPCYGWDETTSESGVGTCWVIPSLRRNEVEWRGINFHLACGGINPPHSSSIGFRNNRTRPKCVTSTQLRCSHAVLSPSRIQRWEILVTSRTWQPNSSLRMGAGNNGSRSTVQINSTCICSGYQLTPAGNNGSGSTVQIMVPSHFISGLIISFYPDRVKFFPFPDNIR